MMAGVTRFEDSLDPTREELCCLSCDYSLRGLPGDVVTCPECGARWNVIRLQTLVRVLSWHDTPGMGKMWAPAWWLFCCSIVMLVVIFAFPPSAEATAWVVALIVTMLAGWILFLRPNYTFFNDVKGLLICILAHGVFVGYLVGILLLLTTAVVGCFSYYDAQIFIPPFVVAVVGTALAVASLFTAYRATKYIGRQCLRQHLRNECMEKNQV